MSKHLIAATFVNKYHTAKSNNPIRIHGFIPEGYVPTGQSYELGCEDVYGRKTALSPGTHYLQCKSSEIYMLSEPADAVWNYPDLTGKSALLPLPMPSCGTGCAISTGILLLGTIAFTIYGFFRDTKADYSEGGRTYVALMAGVGTIATNFYFTASTEYKSFPLLDAFEEMKTSCHAVTQKGTTYIDEIFKNEKYIQEIEAMGAEPAKKFATAINHAIEQLDLLWQQYSEKREQWTKVCPAYCKAQDDAAQCLLEMHDCLPIPVNQCPSEI